MPTSPEDTILCDEWKRCYGQPWRGVVVEEALAHPAKFSRKLIGKVCLHALKQGWIDAGDWVLDPFAGVALGAYHLLPRGINWVGVEVEEKFVEAGTANLVLWTLKFSRCSFSWGDSVLLLGDSRNLRALLEKEGLNIRPRLVISSPPYEQAQSTGGGIARALVEGTDYPVPRAGRFQGYLARDQGSSEGQLARLKGSEFWKAVGEVLAEVKAVLRPGGHCIWILRDYVRDGKKVPFADTWRSLAEEKGFQTLHIHRALLREHLADQLTIDGEAIPVGREYKSFFRRIQERRGAPRIDWEVVLCQRV